jgi:uncharacterized protein (TIGR03790 family)
MLAAMRSTVLGLIGYCWIAAAAAGPLEPAQVAVIYNSAVPESAALAKLYCELRQVPQENLVGLELPKTQDVSRAEFDNTLRKPLLAEFDRRGWWQRNPDADGKLVPASNRIRVLLTLRGVPLRIKPEPKPKDFKDDPKEPFKFRDEAAVDSELALLGSEHLPAMGVLRSMFFGSKVSISEARMPSLMLTARIDGPTASVCERMIRDALETEKTGLWGMAYVDLANKGREGEGYKQGDEWLEGVISANLKAGIPTVVDRFTDTLPKNYPMADAALYYGWYSWNVDGPFVNPSFRFRPGAVAMHLHSFSAEQLANANKNWCGPLLNKGAAATVGNVYEPYLALTHHFDILHERLLAGMTFVDAAWASLEAVSWLGVALGDPLYRPFARFDGTGPRSKPNASYMALRLAALKWGGDPPEMRTQLMAAAERMKSGTLSEALGLRQWAEGSPGEAKVFFNRAKELYPTSPDKLRQDLHLIAILRASPGGSARALTALRDARRRYGGIPEADALAAWLDILDPPAPPPADPTKQPPKPVAPPKNK